MRHARRAVEDTLRVAAASGEAQRAWRALEEARGLLHECPPASVAVWRCASRQREVASSLSVWLRRTQHTSHTALMLLDGACRDEEGGAFV